MKYLFSFLASFLFFAGAFAQNKANSHINESGNTIKDRVETPDGYIRPPFPKYTFQYFLRSLPMQKYGAKVKKYDGYNKFYECYAAVIDLEFDKEKDLVHGAHTIQLLRSMYLYKNKKFDLMRFSYDDNRNMDFQEYAKGFRYVWQDSMYVKKKIAAVDFSKESLDEYMNIVYAESSTNGLAAETTQLEFGNVSVGDLFIQPGDQFSKGHAVLVMDMAVHPVTGERLVLLGQGFNPTEDFHIIDNPYDEDVSPWYRVEEDAHFFTTAQWTFRKKHCRRFTLNANAMSFADAMKMLAEEFEAED